MLTKIAALTAAVTGVLNALVLLGWLNLSTEQITGITVAITVVGSAIHAWLNPDVPFGQTSPNT